MRKRVALISSLLHPSSGGPAAVIREHAHFLSPYADISIFGCVPPTQIDQVRTLYPNARLFYQTWPKRWSRGKGLYQGLVRERKSFDVLHAHMLWDHSTWVAWKVSKQAGCPLVISPHGSLSDHWRVRSLHKRLYWILLLQKMLNEAASIHVLNQYEANACRERGITARIEVIPNGLSERRYVEQYDFRLAESEWPFLIGKRVFLYLGRIAREKGLEILIDAFRRASSTVNWGVVIAGSDYRGYEHILRSKVRALGLESRVLFVGHVSGSQKASLLGASDCMVLPSRGEGFSMSLLEGMAAGLPCVFTRECHFSELASVGGGLEVERTVDALSTALSYIAGLSDGELLAMGNRGRDLGRRRFTSEGVAKSLAQLYTSLCR